MSSMKVKPSRFKNYFTTEVQKNVKSISQAAEGYGFKMLNAGNQQDISIVEPLDSEKTLKEMISQILNLVKDSELKSQLDQFYEEFVESVVDTRTRAMFETRNDKTFLMSIVKIQFWKKSEACLLTYKVSHFEYKCASQMIKVSNESQKYRSTQVLCFGSSSYSSKSSQRFKQMDRGTHEEDIRLLLQLSSMGSEKIDLEIERFALE